MSPVAKSLVDQHKLTLYETIPLHKCFPSYGILLLTTPLVFLNKNFREKIFKTHEGRFLFVWLIVVGGLIFHDKILPPKLTFQAPHFSRGYFFSILVLLSSLGLYQEIKKSLTKFKRMKIMFPILAILFFIPDNVLFIVDRLSENPHSFFLTISTESKQTLDFLNTVKPQKVVCSLDRNLGAIIPAFTNHYSIFGLLYATPFNEEKEILLFNKLLQNKDVDFVIDKYKINIIIISQRYFSVFDRKIARPEWKILYKNYFWKVYEVR
jgi:hypothetical protein